ncbi:MULTISPECIES: DUF4142 domain-containing protein [Spirosoma]|uniref:DUF4142 domain-containing protein n=1 Tax=Spirosoma liriopis TaxID=2937440 RepID=A0ABT0HPL9_9BACT|nr:MULTISPECIES: DUF4142 domain-containing protein [Spirosoma]MCK8493598.1 DUF4142 domain-containing protein [Spirosoma liriopis]UHG93008.1 DUF4142 domain-containing protein [Spirosoma oryzicola]
MKKTILLALFVAGGLSVQSCGSSEKKDSVDQAEQINEEKKTSDDDDSEFAVKAASGGMLEVELGRLAQEKAQNQQVKDFGAMMVTDHSKANDELKSLAASKNITLPTMLGEDHQKHVNELTKLSGKEFDKKYVSLMVDDHKEDIDEFEEASKEAKDADIKAFATKTLPTLKTHLERIESIQSSMK